MKLNLLQSQGTRKRGGGEGGSGAWAILPALLIAGAGIGWAVYIKGYSERQISYQQKRIDAAKSDADEGVKVSKEADDIISQARGLILNSNLAEAMEKHNTVYTSLYDEVRPFIPSTFRLTAMSAAPSGAGVTTLTLNGVVRSYQEYADLMAALYRIPGAQTIARSGFTDDFSWIPGLTTDDQTGRRPLKPGDIPLTDDAYARFEAMVSHAASNPDYTGEGGFGGTGDAPTRRGAMPGYQEVVVNIVLARDTTTPDPRATLVSSAAMWPAVAAAPAPGGAAPAPGAPATGGGRPNTPPAGRPNTPPDGRKPRRR